MTPIIIKFLGLSKRNPEKKDDFSHFFMDAKASEKAKVIRQIMREATIEQESVLEKYRLSKLKTH